MKELLPFEAFRARAVLDDCRVALLELRQNPRGVHWRLRWCAALTLLRAVGHVLRKVDAESTSVAPEFRAAARVWWADLNRTKPDPAIFWEFIDKDRHALLKEYRFSAEQGVTVLGAVGTVPVGRLALGSMEIEPTYFMKDGVFSGRDQRDLVQEAITWWEEQLDEISVRAAAACMIERRPRPNQPPT